MKHLAVLIALCISSIAQAEWQQLPKVIVTEKALGGQVLMLEMKYSLVINRIENEKILAELGEQKRQDFYRDMVMDKTAGDLRKIYGADERLVTNATITRYEQTINPVKPISLN